MTQTFGVFQLNSSRPMESGTRIQLPPPVLVGGGHDFAVDNNRRENHTNTADSGSSHNSMRSNESSNVSSTCSTSSTSSSKTGNLVDGSGTFGRVARGFDDTEVGRSTRSDDDITDCQDRNVLYGSAPSCSTMADTLRRATMRQQQQSFPGTTIAAIRAHPGAQPHTLLRQSSLERSSAPVSRHQNVVQRSTSATTVQQSGAETNYTPMPFQHTENILRINNNDNYSSCDSGNANYIRDAPDYSSASTPSPLFTSTRRRLNSAMDREDLTTTTTATTSLSFSHSHMVSADDSYGEVFDFVNSAHALGWRVENSVPFVTKSNSRGNSVSADSDCTVRSNMTGRDSTRALSLRPPSASVAEVNVHLMQQIADRFETTRIRK